MRPKWVEFVDGTGQVDVPLGMRGVDFLVAVGFDGEVVGVK